MTALPAQVNAVSKQKKLRKLKEPLEEQQGWTEEENMVGAVQGFEKGKGQGQGQRQRTGCGGERRRRQERLGTAEPAGVVLQLQWTRAHLP